MKISLEFDPSDESDLAAAQEFISNLTGTDTGEEEEAETKPAAKSKSKPAAKKKEEEEKPKGPSIDDVRKALKDCASLESREKAIEILKDHGAESVGELAEDKYESVIAAATA